MNGRSLDRAPRRRALLPSVWPVRAVCRARVPTEFRSDEPARGILAWNRWSIVSTWPDAKNISEVAVFQHWMKKTRPGRASRSVRGAHLGQHRAVREALCAFGPNLTVALVVAYLRGVTNYGGNGGLLTRASPGTRVLSTCYVIWVIREDEFGH